MVESASHKTWYSLRFRLRAALILVPHTIAVGAVVFQDLPVPFILAASGSLFALTIILPIALGRFGTWYAVGSLFAGMASVGSVLVQSPGLY